MEGPPALALRMLYDGPFGEPLGACPWADLALPDLLEPFRSPQVAICMDGGPAYTTAIGGAWRGSTATTPWAVLSNISSSSTLFDFSLVSHLLSISTASQSLIFSSLTQFWLSLSCICLGKLAFEAITLTVGLFGLAEPVCSLLEFSFLGGVGDLKRNKIKLYTDIIST